MSILIKGIDMPKEKDEALLLLILGDGTVAEKMGSDRYEEMTDTKAIQIPKGHGRLIDADALETVFKDMAKCEWNQKAFPISWAYAFEDTIDEIYDAPTILEAEE